MDLFTTQAGLAEVLLRWLHIFAGIVWIGLLYYFNLVQGPFMNEVDPTVKTTATRTLLPRALFWFRWSALATWVLGVLIILIRIDQAGGFEIFGTTYGVLILSGMLLGTLMFLNVWGVIWPKQKVVIASAGAVAGGGKADPAAADAGRRALLASRTNVLFSIPMLFFMVSAPHGGFLFEEGSRTMYWMVFGALAGLIELNALAGLTGALKRPLEKAGPTVLSGVVLFGVLYGTLLAA